MNSIDNFKRAIEINYLNKCQTLKQFILETYADEIPDIAEHGCQGGMHGMITYYETGLLYDKFADDIWMTISDHIEGMGETVMTFLGNPNYGNDIVITDNATFKNYMLWVAVEITCQNIM
jgi:predicted Rdx family selenoprotein